MKIRFLFTLILLINVFSALKLSPPERQLLYRDPNPAKSNSFKHSGRVLEGKKKPRKLFLSKLFGPSKSELVKIKAKRDMLKKKIDQDNGKLQNQQFLFFKRFLYLNKKEFFRFINCFNGR